MIETPAPANADPVRRMFGRISTTYDLMNTLISLGQDQAWRRQVIRRANLPRQGRLLDIGTGTGRIAAEAAKRHPLASIIGADFTPDMLKIAVGRRTSARLRWCAANALFLPFADNTFDAVVSGYLIRNVPDLPQALSEQKRVVKPGGRIVCLDTAPPPQTPLKPIILFYLKYVIPLLGTLVAGDRAAYEYLPDSTRHFMAPERLCTLMRDLGFTQVRYDTRMFGTQVIYVGEKPWKGTTR